MCRMMLLCYIFLCKRKTAYVMRISDWSSDVCSSDLQRRRRRIAGGELHDGRSHEIALPVAPRTTEPPAPRGLAVGDQPMPLADTFAARQPRQQVDRQSGV